MKISENKPHSVHLRLTETQFKFCADNAEMMGVSVSDFIRMTINTLVVTSDKLTEAITKNLNENAKPLGDLENANNQSYI